MAKRGKKYQAAAESVGRETLYDASEAVELVKKIAPANFDETVELSVSLGVNPKHADEQLRGAFVLPHGLGMEKTVLVFAKGDKAKEAEAAGADYVGAEDMVEKVQGGWMDFDVAIATPDMMALVGRLGRVLGPRGMMPNPKTGTVTTEVERAVQEAKAGKVNYRTDKAGIIHVPIGKVSFDADKLLGNLRAMMDLLIKARPAAVKGTYVKTVTLSSTMGPGVKINTHKILD